MEGQHRAAGASHDRPEEALRPVGVSHQILPHCRKAYAITRVLRYLTTVLSIGLGLDALTSVAAMAFLFPPGGLLSRFLMSTMGGAALWRIPLVLSLVCGYGAYRLYGLERRWVYTDYNHVERK
mmetsp:Transcript_24940/g.71984  ORF Transcript_24940/g.71984 Transcript_24940/m.71984 type:complete len:124 (-) Transcript_24940:273-644(-)